MPSLADLKLPPSPRADPLSYPGATPEHSYLLLDTWMYPIANTAGLALGQSSVEVDGGPLFGLNGPAHPTLHRGLLLAAATPLADRYPVLAFGSNAAPAQLLDKFAALPAVGRVVPVTRGSVRGFALAHSPHISNPGYVPYVVVDRGPSQRLDAFVLWLDAAQLARLNDTEPNYRLLPVPDDRYPLTLESHETVVKYSLYRGRWGALSWPGDVGPAPAGSQADVYRRLNRAAWFRVLVGRDDVVAQVARLRDDAGLRNRVRLELLEREMVVADRWAGPPAP